MRRALLLFAIVLGLAALASSISRPRQDARNPAGGTDTSAVEQPAAGDRQEAAAPVRLSFATEQPRRRRHLQTGRPAVVTVKTGEPGVVELDGLGLTGTAEPLTPARFDVLVTDPAEASVRFTPAGSDVPRVVGRLSVSAREPARSDAPRARTTEPDR